MAKGKSAKGVKRGPQIAGVDFVKAVQTSANLAEISAKLGLAKTSIQTRMSTYRKKGIPLKKFPKGGGKSLDVKGLAELAAELG